MKMSQVLGEFGLLDFTMLYTVLAWGAFRDLRTVYFFNFSIFSGRGETRITKTHDTESVDTGARLYHKQLHVLKPYLCAHIEQNIQYSIIYWDEHNL
jgi:hypothetical protein